MFLPEIQTHESGRKDLEQMRAFLKELRVYFRDVKFGRGDTLRNDAIDALNLLIDTPDLQKTVIILDKQVKKIRAYCVSLSDEDLIRKVETALFTLSTKDFYYEWLGTLSEEQYKEVTTKVAEYISLGSSTEEIQLRAAVVRELVSNDADNLGVTVKKYFKDDEQNQKVFFEHPFYDWLFEVCLQEPEIKVFELTWLGNWNPQRKEKLREFFQPIKITNQMVFGLPPKDWVLCSSSEHWLFESYDQDGVQVLYSEQGAPLISLKFFGKFAGLVIQSFETPDGFIVPQGAWITVMYSDDREYFDVTFDSGRTKVVLPETSSWYVMRGVRYSNLKNTTQKQHENTFWEDTLEENAKLRKRVLAQPGTNSLAELKKQFQALRAQRKILREKKRHEYGK